MTRAHFHNVNIQKSPPLVKATRLTHGGQKVHGGILCGEVLTFKDKTNIFKTLSVNFFPTSELLNGPRLYRASIRRVERAVRPDSVGTRSRPAGSGTDCYPGGIGMQLAN